MPPPRRYVAYLRVSGGPGQSGDGLGIEGQRRAVQAHVEAEGSVLLGEHVEVESGAETGNRPVLEAALRHCRRTGAGLLVHRLDRLARDALWLLSVERAGVTVLALDNPHGHRLTGRIQALLAEDERDRISARTKAALAAARARGTVLGGWRGGPAVDPALGRAARTRKADTYAADIGPLAARLWAGGPSKRGLSLRAVAAKLVAENIVTPQGGQWTAHAVRTLLARHAAMEAG